MWRNGLEHGLGKLQLPATWRSGSHPLHRKLLPLLRMGRRTMTSTQHCLAVQAMGPMWSCFSAEGQWVKGEVEGRGTLTYGVKLA